MNALLWRKYMNANNQLPAVGTTVYAIAKNNSTFKLEVVDASAGIGTFISEYIRLLITFADTLAAWKLTTTST